ncbi:hypothetical protein EMIHUDRAFT_460530 [Emiliania huxleyi CCMP1516]|uniref:Uncharacterized protein n=2 Tax=Emiliania huxleyi TaxID=2903 RepID=A0A0D3KMT9_EMIH1|nr:hypothetical protein EMIHUDRAFT_460530 [Emiliania huxleyi CCMP1516]EOD37074.1 hypothetical protein EMIHUDRAFT_460530 [Emiliania huxleyi CCMP1516]|eukprot:XP_005789503.1 hypothetical protein EMIHUDRAFT_460530 [Emiliania huxleyi CCMP1516]
MISTSRAPSLDPFASVRTSRFESKETDRLTRARARLSYVESGFGYGWCAAKRPLTNALVLAACFALSLDILEQFSLQGRSLAEVDWRRALGFGLFGLLYLGLFQYAYLIFGFKALPPCCLRHASKSCCRARGPTTSPLRAPEQALFPRAEAFGAASLRDKVSDPRGMLDVLLQTGIDANWEHDARAVVSLWAPIDVLSFSAPLHWRLPLRYVLSLLYALGLSLADHGGASPGLHTALGAGEWVEATEEHSAGMRYNSYNDVDDPNSGRGSFIRQLCWIIIIFSVRG